MSVPSFLERALDPLSARSLFLPHFDAQSASERAGVSLERERLSVSQSLGERRGEERERERNAAVDQTGS